jgi:hypothetical protein
MNEHPLSQKIANTKPLAIEIICKDKTQRPNTPQKLSKKK